MKLRLANLRFGAAGCAGVCAVGPADKAHPNKMPFTGTLLILDKPSDKPPHGAQGHRIFVPTEVAKKRLSTLIDMGVNYTSDLDTHAPQRKVGVITGAKIVGDKVVVNGFMWKRDFPKVEKDMKLGRLGMSMELQDVSVRAKDDPIWYLEDFHFSGATILFKSAAAYTATSLAAAGVKKKGEEYGTVAKAGRNETVLAAMLVRNLQGGSMAEKAKKTGNAAGNGQGELLVKALAASMGPVISAAIKESFEPLITGMKQQQRSIARIAASVEESKVLSLEAGKRDEDEPEEEEEEDIHAAKHEDDDDEMSANGGDDDEDDGHKKKEEDEEDDDDEELDAALENLEDDAAEDKPGELNKEAKNMGDKTTRTGKIGKSKSMGIKGNAGSIQASSVIRELYASHRALRRKYRTLKAKADETAENLQNKVDALEAQVETYAERVDRKTVSAELSNFLAKGGVDVRELRASGQKLAVSEVDDMFANAPVALDPTTRMWFKNQLVEAGMMEQGEVHRGL